MNNAKRKSAFALRREYYYFSEIMDLWDVTQNDIRYFIEQGKLAASIWLDGVKLELGSYRRCTDNVTRKMTDDYITASGLYAISAKDYRKLYIENEVHIKSLKAPKGKYYKIYDIAGELIHFNDLVISAAEKERFENEYFVYDDDDTDDNENSDSEFDCRLDSTKSTDNEADITDDFTKPPAPIIAKPPPDDIPRFKQQNDFRNVTYNNENFTFTPLQAQIVKILYEKAKTDNSWIHGKKLLDLAGSESFKISRVFNRHPNWKRIIFSDNNGYYRLLY